MGCGTSTITSYLVRYTIFSLRYLSAEGEFDNNYGSSTKQPSEVISFHFLCPFNIQFGYWQDSIYSYFVFSTTIK